MSEVMHVHTVYVLGMVSPFAPFFSNLILWMEWDLFTLLYSGNPLQAFLQTVKTQMKCHIMQHFVRIYTVHVYVKISSDKIIQYFLYFKQIPLDMCMYNGISQVYCYG